MRAGPEAGVWVIAETTDLPTRFVRIVVTDDQGRYLLPDLPKATYNVWVRGLRVGGFAEGAGDAGKDRRPHGRDRRQPPRRRAVLPGGLLVLTAARARERRVPGDVGQRHLAADPEPGRVAAQREVWRLLGVSPARRQGHARDSSVARQVSVDGSRVGAAHPVGSGRPQHDRRHQPARVSCADALCGLERSRGEGRAAAGAAPPGGSRAKRRDHAMGLGRSEGVPARRSLDRSTQPHCERGRLDLRIARAERGLPAGARSGASHHEPGAADRPRSEHASHFTRHAAALAVLGQRRRLDEPQQRAQPDVRRAGPCVADVRGPRLRQP